MTLPGLDLCVWSVHWFGFVVIYGSLMLGELRANCLTTIQSEWVRKPESSAFKDISQLQNSIKKTRGNKNVSVLKSSDWVRRSESFYLGHSEWCSLTNASPSFLCVSTNMSTPTHTHMQQWIRSDPERGGLLLRQDLLWDHRGRFRFRRRSGPADSGPGLCCSPQLGFVRVSAGIRGPDPRGSQAQVQLQLVARADQAQSAQPVGPQQLLADPHGASVSGGFRWGAKRRFGIEESQSCSRSAVVLVLDISMLLYRCWNMSWL